MLFKIIFFAGNFVPFAMGTNVRGEHPIGNKTPASPNAPEKVSATLMKKKSRIDVKDVFNNDDDEDSVNNPKKRKLVPLGKRIYF